MEFSKQNQIWGKSHTAAASYDAGLRAYMLQIYNYMASALALTGIVAWVAAASQGIMSLMYQVNASGQLVGMTGLGWVVAFAPLVFVLVLSMKIQTMSFQAAQASFWAFAVVMGLSMASLFYIYTGVSIARVFLITAITFGSMSMYGYVTKRDLTGMGSFFIMGVWGIIIASLINLWLHSPGLYFAISAIGVLLFVGLTAYDTQRLKSLYFQVSGGTNDQVGKVSIMGALSLYLDFINLFIMLLRFFGDRR